MANLKKYLKGLSAHLKESKNLAQPNNDTTEALINNTIASILLDLAKSMDKVVLTEEVRESNCPYCHEPYKELETTASNAHVQIVKVAEGYALSTYFEGEQLSEEIQDSYEATLTPLRNCPICGRELGNDK